MLTAGAVGLPDTIVLFTTATNQVVPELLAVLGSKRHAMGLAINRPAKAILAVAGVTSPKIARCTMATKPLAKIRLDVRGTTVIVPILTAINPHARVRLDARGIPALTPALACTTPTALAHTIRIVVPERMLPETVPEYTAQLVAVRHRAEVLTTKPTVTPSLGAAGRPQSH